jgi:hypothetical protein
VAYVGCQCWWVRRSARGERAWGRRGPRAAVEHRDGHTGLDLLQASDDEAIARGESTPHEPLVTEGAIQLDSALLDLVVRAHHERRGGAIESMSNPLLRGEDGPFPYAFFDGGAHEHAGQQQVVGGKMARRVTEPVPWSTVTSENWRVPGVS